MSTDYERYIRTDELLSLQKGPEELVNHDELLFQVTHQSSELWMKAALHDVSLAVQLMRVPAPELRRTARLLNRASRITGMLASQILVLELMAPADYHEIRTALGRGSGQDSPGFNRLLGMARPLAEAYEIALSTRGATPVEILRSPQAHEELHALIQALLEFDEQFGRFRQAHLSLVRRQIGLDVLSLKGVPAQKLQAGTQATMFPDLWNAISALTNSLHPAY